MTSDVSSTGEAMADAGAPSAAGSIDELAAPRAESGAAPAQAAPAPWHRRLAVERERQGLSIADVAGRLRLHPKQVAAIEAAELNRLPSGTYLRGFVRNYAQLLGLEPAPILAGLESSAGLSAVPARAVLPHGAPPARPGEGGSRPLVIGAVLLALAVFAFAGWWSSRESAQRVLATKNEAVLPAAPTAAQPNQGAAEPAANVPAGEPPQGNAGGPAPAGEAPVGSGAASAGATAASGPDASAVGGARPDLPALTTVPPVEEAARPATTAQTGGVVRLRFQVGNRPSWIEVVDARGQLLLAELQRPGSERTVDGRAPLRLTVGNASAVQVEARGRLLDLRQHTSANDVARLTID